MAKRGLKGLDSNFIGCYTTRTKYFIWKIKFQKEDADAGGKFSIYLVYVFLVSYPLLPTWQLMQSTIITTHLIYSSSNPTSESWLPSIQPIQLCSIFPRKSSPTSHEQNKKCSQIQVRVKLASMCCEARQDERRKHQLKKCGIS